MLVASVYICQAMRLQPVMPWAHAAALVVVLAADAHAKLADKYVASFTVGSGCIPGQRGVAPVDLATDLPIGYDYSCYNTPSINQRWSTGHPVNVSALLDEDVDLESFVREYFMSAAAKVLPIVLFGIISAVACCGWSCCCGGWGKCCDSPSQGAAGKVLLIAVVAMRVAVVGLAIHGFAVNRVQHDAINKLGGATDLLESWLDSAIARVDNVSTHLALVQADTDTTPTLNSTFIDAATGISSINTTVGTLRDTISSVKTLSDGVLDPVNTYRHAGTTAVWGALLALMLMELMTAYAAYKVRPSWACAVTGLFVGVLSIVFIVIVIVAVVTVVLSDICSSPDATLIDAFAEPPANASTTTDDDSVLPEVEELLTYYVTCDTDATITNPFNELVAEIFSSFRAANDTIASLQSDGVGGNLSARFATLTQTVVGSSSLNAAIPDQGMTDGVFSLVQCYQVNTRYHAVIGLVCGQFVGTMAMTLEYLLAAVSLMVAAEIGKRMLRPYIPGDVKWSL